MKDAKNELTMEGAVVKGDVTLGKDVSVWYNAVIRGDEAPITIGDSTNVQDNCVLHVSTGHPLTIGSGVTIGHGAIVHGCTIGDNTLIGMGAIIMDGAKIGKNCIVGAGTLVTQNKSFPDGALIMGSPAQLKRSLREPEIQANKEHAEEYVRLAKSHM
ncbi:MAG: gamma carbonic anhydrase family protein [Lachnospiraceae bacterium]|nr:gamma carbonic anhydrase family protein [Lachnospiraceae bacterium]